MSEQDDANDGPPCDDTAWEHLPHNPLGFFGLAADFERRDLKRAYGKLIRKFKPETHPQEFQRIRAAYEQLENANRYGQSQQSNQVASDSWDFTPRNTTTPSSEPSSSAQTSSGSTSSPRSPKPAATTPPEEAPKETYKRLVAKSPRSPQDFYVLAILSDVLFPPPETTPANPNQQPQAAALPPMYRWLLKGFKEHPRDPGLRAMLTEFLKHDVSIELAGLALRQLAGTIRSAAFYPMAEALCERVLRQQGFENFLNIITQCEKSIRQTDLRSRDVFYLRILRTAIWTAPPQWTDKKTNALEAQSAGLDHVATRDLEFLASLRNYLKGQSPEKSRQPTRQNIDRMLHDYCTSDGWQNTAAVIDGFNRIASDGHGIRNTFSLSADDNDHELFMLILMVSEDLSESSSETESNISDLKKQQNANAAFRDVMATLPAVGKKFRSIAMPSRIGIPILLCITVCLVLSVVLVVLDNAIGQSGFTNFMIVATSIAATIGIYALYVYPNHIREKVYEQQRQALYGSYNELWRERMFRYVQSSSEPTRVALGRLPAAAHDADEEYWASVLVDCCESDLGLTLFATAQRFVV